MIGLINFNSIFYASEGVGNNPENNEGSNLSIKDLINASLNGEKNYRIVF
ncbi:MAG: hypothetical protein Q9M97_09485 [Candidatus Gracilibacteria bacterium]|nr:hypothetical protein [Candidatus Gracilibacteria bacterium]